MATEGHWVAVDGGGSGTNLPDRSGNGRDGTLTGGCTWTTVSGEDAINCPSSDYIGVPDDAAWDPANITIFLRARLNSLSSQPGLIAHSEGGGPVNKWAVNYGFPSGSRLFINLQPNDFYVGGDAYSINTTDIFVFVIRRNGGSWLFRIYDDAGSLLINGTATQAQAFANAAAQLVIGWGGESFFNSDVDVVAARIESTAASDSDIDAIAADPELAGTLTVGGGEGAAVAYYWQLMGA